MCVCVCVHVLIIFLYNAAPKCMLLNDDILLETKNKLN